ncbi:nucleotidyl transferase AbiEii/AbiGii toxin family protein [Methylobacterium sp. A54F]
MSTPPADVVPLDLPIISWVEAARTDPVGHRRRQVTHILLSAIGLTPKLREAMLLKGGALMMLGFGSPRGTQDVDFTVTDDPEPFASQLKMRLNPALARAAATLGYADLFCQIQRIKRQPRPEMFEEAMGPALSLTIGYARRGTNEEKRLLEGQSTNVLQVDLSFREPVLNTTEATLGKPDLFIRTYAFEDVVAEKFRALLQQPDRNRARRQDVFDLAWLARTVDQPVTDEMRAKILMALIEKSAARGITPSITSMDNPEIARRAASEWGSLEAELEGELPPFEEAFAITRNFYVSLPWA